MGLMTMGRFGHRCLSPIGLLALGMSTHTIASNYARAVDKVAELLVNDDLLAPICQAITGKDKFISGKFQIVFKVPLHHNETRAGDPKLVLTQIYPEGERLE